MNGPSTALLQRRSIAEHRIPWGAASPVSGWGAKTLLARYDLHHPSSG